MSKRKSIPILKMFHKNIKKEQNYAGDPSASPLVIKLVKDQSIYFLKKF